MDDPSPAPRHVRLFRDNSNQAVQIPADFELPGTQALIRREGDRLIIEPLRPNGLAELLDSWGPLDEDFPDPDDPPATPEEFF